MSTRSIIKIVRENGTKESIYCHYDGYIEGVGVTLQLAYNTADRVNELMELGNLSSLGYYLNPTDNTHSFDTPQNDVCVAYHRDRGESLEHCDEGGWEEYVYTFYESVGYWTVKYWEHKFDKTKGMEILRVDSFSNIKEELLIDAIMRTNVDNNWVDDEFALKGEVIDTCIEKAREAREETLERISEYRLAEISAFCD